jgi:diaminohydroxyphosphoribosylaminopyrimidine deaminase/5-amino-6-(5-phosphoribosylamino)uracil reductase
VTDEDAMRRAIALAAAQVGRTGDNPAVGCVLTFEGKIVGEGATGDGGRPHAEEIALKAAGYAAREATAYVTLEPCAERSDGSRSCSERLAGAGVERVVVACEDPSVLAAGRGEKNLRRFAVAYEVGLLREEAQRLYAGYHPRQNG